MPITASIWPWQRGLRGWPGDVRIDVADGDRDAFGQAGPDGGLGGEATGPATQGRQRKRQLVFGEVREPWVQSRQEFGRRPRSVLVDALVAGGADVARLDATQLPDDPVGGFDPPVGGGVDFGVFFQQLQAFRELPLRGDAAAVARQPGFAAFGRQRVDAISVRLGGVVLPQLHVRVRAISERVGSRQRRPVSEHREHGACGEVGGDTDYLLGRDATRRERLRYRIAKNVDVVFRVLQRPVGRQRLARQLALDDAVPVVVHRAAHLLPVGDANHKRTT